ncbi:MAG: hypothetical protein ABJA02_06145 [Acidobacteriota bacterium]
MLKTGLSTLLVLFASCIAIYADVPPDSGYQRVSTNIVIESADDLADFRFFLQSGRIVKEVEVKKGEQTVIHPLGGGAFYGSGTLLAVRAKDLSSFGSDNDAVEKAVFEGGIPDIIRLVDHRFTRDVRTSEASVFKDSVYRLERNKDGLVTASAVTTADPIPEHAPVTAPFGVSAGIGKIGWATIIAGCLMTLGLIVFGAMMFRRSNQKV